MRDERGSVSIVVAGVMATLVAFSMGAADLARVLAAAARAQTAADAAALAAVQEQAVSTGLVPADVAAEYAARNGAELTECACEAGRFETEVAVLGPVGPLFLFPDDRVVVARARAVVDLPE